MKRWGVARRVADESRCRVKESGEVQVTDKEQAGAVRGGVFVEKRGAQADERRTDQIPLQDEG